MKDKVFVNRWLARTAIERSRPRFFVFHTLLILLCHILTQEIIVPVNWPDTSLSFQYTVLSGNKTTTGIKSSNLNYSASALSLCLSAGLGILSCYIACSAIPGPKYNFSLFIDK